MKAVAVTGQLNAACPAFTFNAAGEKTLPPDAVMEAKPPLSGPVEDNTLSVKVFNPPPYRVPGAETNPDPVSMESH